MEKEEFVNGILCEMLRFKEGGREVFSRSHGEVKVLAFLAKSNETIPSEISSALLLSNARIAATLNSLERKCLVTREINPCDRRKIIVRLTAEGKELQETVKNEAEEAISVIFKGLGEKEAEQFLFLFRKVNNILTKNKSM